MQSTRTDAELDAILEESLHTTWNAQVVDYDRARFPFDRWILERINLMGYTLHDLTRLHEVIADKDAYKVTKQLCRDTNLPEFRELMKGFAFKDGERYAEYREGDKLAEYGLAALIAGGGVALAAKSGLLGKMLKPIIVGVVALVGVVGSWIKKITGKKS